MTLYNVNGQRPITPTSIMTASRRYVDLLDPHPDVVDLGDLARGLEEPRFRGQTQAPITVEDHMLRCARFGLALSQPIDVIELAKLGELVRA